VVLFYLTGRRSLLLLVPPSFVCPLIPCICYKSHACNATPLASVIYMSLNTCICYKSHACNAIPPASIICMSLNTMHMSHTNTKAMLAMYHPLPSQHSQPIAHKIHFHSFGRWQIRQPCSVPGAPLYPR